MKKPKTRKIDLREEPSRIKLEQQRRVVKISLDQILWAISKSHGLPFEVAALLKVSSATVHRWMQDYPEVRKAMQLRMMDKRHELVSDAIMTAQDPSTKNRLGWSQHAIALVREEEVALAASLPDDSDGESYQITTALAPPKPRADAADAQNLDGELGDEGEP